MATCRWCGADNAENAVTCANCGQSVVEPGQQPPAPPVPPAPPAPVAPVAPAPPAPPAPAAPQYAAPQQPQYAPPPQAPQYAPQPQAPQYAPPQQYAPQYAAPQYAPPQQAPKSGLVNAILVTILCCWPLGGVAIYFATQVDKRWNSGDFQGARDAAKKANLFATLAAVLGLIISCVYVIAMVASEGGSTYTY